MLNYFRYIILSQLFTSLLLSRSSLLLRRCPSSLRCRSSLRCPRSFRCSTASSCRSTGFGLCPSNSSHSAGLCLGRSNGRPTNFGLRLRTSSTGHSHFHSLFFFTFSAEHEEPDKATNYRKPIILF
uniref:Secreted protein n=1 Tax=Meloidogyne incognita TaxID=6306 RepID=A0A914L1Q3_MELIC